MFGVPLRRAGARLQVSLQPSLTCPHPLLPGFWTSLSLLLSALRAPGPPCLLSSQTLSLFLKPPAWVCVSGKCPLLCGPVYSALALLLK